MNLPDFFIADLPADAIVTPGLITSACEALKRNRKQHLKSRTTREIIHLLCEVGKEWRSPANPFRCHALRLDPEMTGFSRPILERGLEDFFAGFTSENWSALIARQLGGAGCLDAFTNQASNHTASPASVGPGRSQILALGPELMVHFAAGNLPIPAFMGICLGLILRSAQFIKCSSKASVLPRLFAHSIHALDPKIGSCIEIAAWPGGDAALETPLLDEADCVTMTGSDEAVNSIRMRMPAQARFLAHGHRVGFGYISREMLGAGSVNEMVSRVADDVTAWDQNGCLSPQVVYVEERGEVESDQFAGRVAMELGRRETLEPRGPISPEEAAAIVSRRAIAEALALHRADVKIWSSPKSTAWTVVFEHDVRYQGCPLNRFLLIKPVSGLEDVFRGMDGVRRHISSVGIGASPTQSADLALALARWGVPRICPIGRMQKPPLDWHQDGRPTLADMVSWSGFEAE